MVLFEVYLDKYYYGNEKDYRVNKLKAGEGKHKILNMFD